MPHVSFPALGISEAFEPGDRVEVGLADRGDLLIVPNALWFAAPTIETIEDESGTPFEIAADPLERHVTVRGLGDVLRGVLAERLCSVWLEYRGPGHYRLLVQEETAPPETEELTTEQGISVFPDPEDRWFLRGGPSTAASLADFQLALRAARLSTHGGFEQLICLPLLREMELLEHQVRTAKTVLRRFRGRALLCDEVGLGKTIEAGIVLAELAMRGLVHSVLVLTPPSLIEQWQGEMRRKFSLDFTTYDAPAFREAGP